MFGEFEIADTKDAWLLEGVDMYEHPHRYVLVSALDVANLVKEYPGANWKLSMVWLCREGIVIRDREEYGGE